MITGRANKWRVCFSSLKVSSVPESLAVCALWDEGKFVFGGDVHLQIAGAAWKSDDKTLLREIRGAAVLHREQQEKNVSIFWLFSDSHRGF